MNRMQSLEMLYHALNTKPDFDQAALYLKETEVFSDAIVEAACRTLGRQSEFFPKLSELITECRYALKVVNDADPRTWFKCQYCGDSGWVLEDCPGGSGRICGRSEGPGFQDGSYWGTCRRAHVNARRCGHAA